MKKKTQEIKFLLCIYITFRNELSEIVCNFNARSGVSNNSARASSVHVKLNKFNDKCSNT